MRYPLPSGQKQLKLAKPASGPKPPDGAGQLTDWVDWEPGSITGDGGREMVEQEMGSLSFHLWSLAGNAHQVCHGDGVPKVVGPTAGMIHGQMEGADHGCC